MFKIFLEYCIEFNIEVEDLLKFSTFEEILKYVQHTDNMKLIFLFADFLCLESSWLDKFLSQISVENETINLKILYYIIQQSHYYLDLTIISKILNNQITVKYYKESQEYLKNKYLTKNIINERLREIRSRL